MAALGSPREGEGVALGKPRDGEGKPASDTAEGKVGKLLRCSLFTRRRKIKIHDKHVNYVAKHKIGQGDSGPPDNKNSHIHSPHSSWFGEQAALWLLCGNSCRDRHGRWS